MSQIDIVTVSLLKKRRDGQIVQGGVSSGSSSGTGGVVMGNALRTSNFSIEEEEGDLVIKYGTAVIHRITAPESGKSDILATGGVGVNQTL